MYIAERPRYRVPSHSRVWSCRFDCGSLPSVSEVPRRLTMLKWCRQTTLMLKIRRGMSSMLKIQKPVHLMTKPLRQEMSMLKVDRQVPTMLVGQKSVHQSLPSVKPSTGRLTEANKQERDEEDCGMGKHGKECRTPAEAE